MTTTPLTNLTPKNSYSGLLRTVSVSGITAALQTVSDGDGVDSALQISTTAVAVSGLRIDGAIMTASATELNRLDRSAATTTVEANKAVIAGPASGIQYPILDNFRRTYTNLATITSSGEFNVDVAHVHRAELGGNSTLYFVDCGLPSGYAVDMDIILVQDSTGERTVTWPSSVTWVDNHTAPTIHSGVRLESMFKFTTVDGGNEWLGYMV